MKKTITLLVLTATASLSAQNATMTQPEKPKQVQVVDASCGQCNFGMKGGGCTLAVKIDGKPYFVEGTKLDDHGDAHAADGFCSAVRKAEVTGEVVDDKFKATSFKLLPLKSN